MEEDTQQQTGAFLANLQRNNKQIRLDRAVSIAEDTQMSYKRAIEDMELELKKLGRERNNMLDLSPTTATSLVLASDFDGSTFVTKDIEIGVKIQLQKERPFYSGKYF